MELEVRGMVITYRVNKFGASLEFDCDNDPYYTRTGADLYNKSEVEQVYKFLGEVLDSWDGK